MGSGMYTGTVDFTVSNYEIRDIEREHDLVLTIEYGLDRDDEGPAFVCDAALISAEVERVGKANKYGFGTCYRKPIDLKKLNPSFKKQIDDAISDLACRIHDSEVQGCLESEAADTYDRLKEEGRI